MPPALREFLRLFRGEEFWESHEALEGPWRESGSGFYQGLILYASAWVHWRRENAHGVRAQLRKTEARLGGYPESYLGIDVGAIRDHCREVREALESEQEGWSGRIGPIPLAFDPERVRGDEAEWDVGSRRDSPSPGAGRPETE